MAGFRAFSAVRHVMLGALVTARLTDICAYFANFLTVLAASSHNGSGHGADLGAVHIPSDALGHHLDVWLFQAGCCAMVAGRGTDVAGFDTSAVHFM